MLSSATHALGARSRLVDGGDAIERRQRRVAMHIWPMDAVGARGAMQSQVAATNTLASADDYGERLCRVRNDWKNVQ